MKVGESSIAASRPASRSDLLRRGRGGASVGGGVVMVVVTTISLAFQAVPLAGHVGVRRCVLGNGGRPRARVPGTEQRYCLVNSSSLLCRSASAASLVF